MTHLASEQGRLKAKKSGGPELGSHFRRFNKLEAVGLSGAAGICEVRLARKHFSAYFQQTTNNTASHLESSHIQLCPFAHCLLSLINLICNLGPSFACALSDHLAFFHPDKCSPYHHFSTTHLLFSICLVHHESLSGF